jgi:hypothetical protein
VSEQSGNDLLPVEVTKLETEISEQSDTDLLPVEVTKLETEIR